MGLGDSEGAGSRGPWREGGGPRGGSEEGVGECEEPVLSDLARERAVDCRREVGVGLGVPRSLGSGLALLGGRGKEIKELATFSLTTWAGLCLVGRVGVSEATEKLLAAGHAQVSLA